MLSHSTFSFSERSNKASSCQHFGHQETRYGLSFIKKERKKNLSHCRELIYPCLFVRCKALEMLTASAFLCLALMTKHRLQLRPRDTGVHEETVWRLYPVSLSQNPTRTELIHEHETGSKNDYHGPNTDWICHHSLSLFSMVLSVLSACTLQRRPRVSHANSDR